MATQWDKKEDHVHTSGPQDSARVLRSTGTRLVTVTRPEGRVSSWKGK